MEAERADLAGYRSLVRLECAQCRREFWRPPNEARRGAKYCGRQCRDAALRGQFAGSANPRWIGPQPCKHCGKPVKTRRGGKRLFCSRECFYIGGMSDWIRRDENGVRYCGRIDENQPEIVEALRAAGAGVIVASNLGNGFPDLIVGTPRNTLLMEVKNPKGDYGKRGLNKLQKAFHETWPGPIYVVRSVEEALKALKEWL